MIQATGVILSGGKSRRMGQDKAFLTVGREEMIVNIAAELSKLFDEVLISGAKEIYETRLGLRVVPDLFIGGGPLSGIHAALVGASHQKCLVVGCDMPFISSGMANLMLREAEGYDIAVPRHGRHLQPLFAVYSKSCIPVIEEALRAFRYKIIDFYPKVRVNYVNEKKLRTLSDIDVTFFNVNTPEDLCKARSLASEKKESGE